MNSISRIVLLVSLLLAASSWANTVELNSGQQQTTLLELFPSEGCSSCPPAEHWVNSFKDDPRLWKEVIPLAFHVDYWDYIGWKDTFATPDNSYRQRHYHQEGGIDTVYTPGFVSNGKEWRRWFGIKKLERSQKQPGRLRVSISDGIVKAKFDAAETSEEPLKLNIAILGFGLKTKIRAGENAGKTLLHDFVVIGKSEQNSYTGQWTTALPDVQKHDVTRTAIAVWVTSTSRQQPIQSVGGWLQ